MLSLRSIIMIFLLLAMQPMAMPSLMSANYTRPSIQVYSLANEDIVSTVDFVGTTVEMESTGVPSFSLAEFIMSIDYESVKAFAQDFSKKYEAFAEAFTDAMSAIFEFFSMEYNAYKQSINYESIKAFAQDFIEKYEAFIQAFTNAMSAIFEYEAFHQPIDYESVMSSTEAYIQEVSTAMFSKIELVIQKFEAYNQEFQVEYHRVYKKKLENFATDLLIAAAPAWPSLLDPEFIVRDVFDRVESYTTKDPIVPAPAPPLLSLEDAQSIAAMEVVLDSSTTFGAMVIALLLVATLTTVIYASSVIDRELISMEDLSIVLETPCLSMTDLRKKMTPSVILCSADAYARYQASCDKSKDPSIVDLCNLFANISFQKDTTDPSKNESF
ncbi:unnamed protein product [Cylindrotheca closterium]|uniref:Uncharacterized protein n=1 Tax=Cylindrotheca closterium TaxID=2856 RepID=A0AAD2JKM4_9STRA|nr:unnamed protein product [Cylindrotheca closterium]